MLTSMYIMPSSVVWYSDGGPALLNVKSLAFSPASFKASCSVSNFFSDFSNGILLNDSSTIISSLLFVPVPLSLISLNPFL